MRVTAVHLYINHSCFYISRRVIHTCMSDGRQLPPRGGVSLPDELQDLQIGIVVHDPETGAMLDANRRLEALYGYTAAELRELTVEAISANTYSYTQRAAQRRITAAAEGTPQELERLMRRTSSARLRAARTVPRQNTTYKISRQRKSLIQTRTLSLIYTAQPPKKGVTLTSTSNSPACLRASCRLSPPTRATTARGCTNTFEKISASIH